MMLIDRSAGRAATARPLYEPPKLVVGSPWGPVDVCYDAKRVSRYTSTVKGGPSLTQAKDILKAELKRRHVTYDDLVEKLAAIGIKETEPNIRTKISRGGFTAVFFVQCLIAIGAHTIRLHEPD